MFLSIKADAHFNERVAIVASEPDGMRVFGALTDKTQTALTLSYWSVNQGVWV
ncbi:hypothetical protein OOK60_13505 [Trichothermofontia sichuanensis B231]|uniref:hypothetical protein n=1 Tax=Trichothermofontia sichuanensis TaxID=3045816 RepID=UPI002245BBA6|nr:hypothetical protein [Trichothermofontia sichuanensis]UZQ53510.1 hypothetical protein OOK60_13505 [Trichothermofontia sichuanensis B231]